VDRDFIQRIEQFIPPGFWILLGEEYEEDYPGAVAHCMARFDEPEAHDLIGDERRARTETSFKRTVEKFAHKGMRVIPQRNNSGSHNHQEARVGPIVLTQSFADSPEALIQHAGFRNTLARSRNISWLDPDPVVEEAVDELLYGIVLHGARRVGFRQRRYDEFGFLSIAIPNADCTKYLDVINLAERYANSEVDPNDIAAMMERGVPIERQRRPNSVFEQYRRRASDES